MSKAPEARLKCSGRAHRTNCFQGSGPLLARALHDHARRTRSAGCLPRTGAARYVFSSFASCFILRLDRVLTIYRREGTHAALRVSIRAHQSKDHKTESSLHRSLCGRFAGPGLFLRIPAVSDHVTFQRQRQRHSLFPSVRNMILFELKR